MDDPFNGKCIIKCNKIIGRHLVANKDIQAGETILKEEPIIVSPLWHSEPRCANCYRETSTICKTCTIFPLCSQCSSHDQFDCTFIKNQELPVNFLVENFAVFAPLKALLYLENETTQNHHTFLEMECHTEERKRELIWESYKRTVVEPLLKHLKEAFRRTPVNEEFIQKICGIFDVNAFEIRGPDGIDCLRAIYPSAALMAHSCIANTLVSVDDSFQIKIYATRLIRKDELIHYNYTNPLLGTAERRKQLALGKYFVCECKRCADPTELETEQWSCANCSSTVLAHDVKELLKEMDTEIRDAAGDLRLMEMLLMRYLPRLNPSHYIIIDLKQNIASILRDICMDPMSKPGRKVLERKIQLCDDIIPVLTVVEPGISRLVAIALYEKFIPMLELARREYETAEIGDVLYLDRLYVVESILRTAIEMLLYEQVQSAEGRLLKKALREMGSLRKTISYIQNKIRNE
ncbi:SET domain-containing protein SmydA-8-like isoform X2 [Hermetia illucens]|uniref:SET domain-containing protein SmydA-8-like isoform X2 n=1 Tax=Hermetia illucens TaxID=343691 RepID=UPI0018CC54D2|nr:SET domain-containing protein SmydA-8-like isoform X2 [Hermetia illucens]